MKIKDATIVREIVYKIIFSNMFLEDENNESLVFWKKEDNRLNYYKENVQDFLNEENASNEVQERVFEYLDCFVNSKESFEKQIENHLKEGFTLKRILKTDLSILFVAMIELKFNRELSEKIIINEAIEIAKKYSSENSYKFINGILRNLVKEIRNE